ncbi:MAG TPA: DUF4159 domain-containing protein [Saprospiraceae bacterium]|nr:DUF4159 domain-containing protein [Saprospiraceae bacterium]HQU95737.1 DUF4159 domain-containing protein [Saprospiraceae bacterium]
MMLKLIYYLLLFSPLVSFGNNNPPTLRLALLKYAGGGDWYNDVNSLKNLALFCNQKMGTNFDPDYVTVEPGSAELFANPITYMTGHGNVIFSDAEALNMRKYLIGGGFLIINDDYGMDPFIRPAFKKVFPELSLVEIPINHPVYHTFFQFQGGMPKIHEHDNKPAQGYGLFWEGRLVALYNFESDLGDGWDDIHNDPFELRLKALQMGANIVKYAFEK